MDLQWAELDDGDPPDGLTKADHVLSFSEEQISTDPGWAAILPTSVQWFSTDLSFPPKTNVFVAGPLLEWKLEPGTDPSQFKVVVKGYDANLARVLDLTLPIPEPASALLLGLGLAALALAVRCHSAYRAEAG